MIDFIRDMILKFVIYSIDGNENNFLHSQTCYIFFIDFNTVSQEILNVKQIGLLRNL